MAPQVVKLLSKGCPPRLGPDYGVFWFISTSLAHNKEFSIYNFTLVIFSSLTRILSFKMSTFVVICFVLYFFTGN